MIALLVKYLLRGMEAWQHQLGVLEPLVFIGFFAIFEVLSTTVASKFLLLIELQKGLQNVCLRKFLPKFQIETAFLDVMVYIPTAVQVLNSFDHLNTYFQYVLQEKFVVSNVTKFLKRRS